MTTTEYGDIAERFRRDTADHRMTVLHDDGLYRQIRFAGPRNEIHRFDLITWPNGLLIRGDGPNFVFSVFPTADLFDLFRRSMGSGINPGYWQEKVIAGQVTSWSEKKFDTWLGSEATKNESRHPGLLAAVGEHFLYGGEHSTEYEETARHAVEHFEYDGFRFRFPAKWEHDFEDYDWSFLWGCHAIVWGIGRYDAALRELAAASQEVAA
jgi:hypothetical protein